MKPSWGSQFAKPKDPSQLDIEDKELARDYNLMYTKYTEMEAKFKRLSAVPDDMILSKILKQNPNSNNVTFDYVDMSMFK